MSRIVRLAALVVAALAVACSGEAGDASDASVSINLEARPASLAPAASGDHATGTVLRQLFAGLVEYDATTGEPELLVAESVESDDNVTWTIELRDGWTFHDGSDVTAASFADAWSVSATSPQHAALFEHVVGFGEIAMGEADELAGVTVVDELTLEVELARPFGPFPTALGHVAFSPLPEAYFEDPEAFGEAPVGNGRYRFQADASDDERIVLERYDDYAGPIVGTPASIVFEVIENLSTAYLEAQEGNLDILFQVPGDREATAEDDFDGRVERSPISQLTFLGYPLYDERFDDPDLRRALSLAIDRQEIIDSLFDGAGEPATAIVPPVLDAHREGACDACEFDPDAARDLYDAAGGIDGPVTLYYFPGGDNEEWVTAVANQWVEHLGVTIDDGSFEAVGSDFFELASGQQLTGPFQLGWALEYLSPQYALELYTSQSGFNFFGYASDAFDEAYADAVATTGDEAEEGYLAAEDILLEDLPLIPMWYSQRTIVWGEGVQGVVMDPMGYVRVELVTLED